MRSHTHWPDGKGPTCTFATKRECDEALRAHNQQAKATYEQAKADAHAKEQERRRKAQDDFIASERERMGMTVRVIRLIPNE